MPKDRYRSVLGRGRKDWQISCQTVTSFPVAALCYQLFWAEEITGNVKLVALVHVKSKKFAYFPS